MQQIKRTWDWGFFFKIMVRYQKLLCVSNLMTTKGAKCETIKHIIGYSVHSGGSHDLMHEL